MGHRKVPDNIFTIQSLHHYYHVFFATLKLLVKELKIEILHPI